MSLGATPLWRGFVAIIAIVPFLSKFSLIAVLISALNNLNQFVFS